MARCRDSIQKRLDTVPAKWSGRNLKQIPRRAERPAEIGRARKSVISRRGGAQRGRARGREECAQIVGGDCSRRNHYTKGSDVYTKGDSSPVAFVLRKFPAT